MAEKIPTIGRFSQVVRPLQLSEDLPQRKRQIGALNGCRVLELADGGRQVLA